MSNEPLDKHFRDQLGDYRSPVDGEALWQALEPAVRKRRRPIAWWMVGLLFLAVGLLAWQWQAWAETEARVTEQEAARANLPEKMQPPREPRAADPNLDLMQLASTPDAAADEGQAPSRPAPAESVADMEAQPSQASSVKTSRRNATTANPINDEETTTPSNTQALDAASTAIAQETPKHRPAPSPVAPDPINRLTSGADAGRRPGPASQARVALLEQPPLPLLSLPTEDPSAVTEALAGDLPSYGHRRSPWFFQMRAGLFSSPRELTAQDSLGYGWIDDRRETETTLEALSAELLLGYQHRRGWQLRTGVGLTEWTNRFEWVRSEEQTDTITGVTSIVINPGGDTTQVVEGPITRYRQLTYYKRTYNTLRQWDIPLLAAYQFGYGAWRFTVEGGLRFNIKQEAEGEVLNMEGEVAPWAEVGQLRSSVGLSYQAGAAVGYPLTPRLQVQLGAQFRYFPQAFTEAGAAISERRQLLGGQLGIQWRW